MRAILFLSGLVMLLGCRTTTTDSGLSADGAVANAFADVKVDIKKDRVNGDHYKATVKQGARRAFLGQVAIAPQGGVLVKMTDSFHPSTLTAEGVLVVNATSLSFKTPAHQVIIAEILRLLADRGALNSDEATRFVQYYTPEANPSSIKAVHDQYQKWKSGDYCKFDQEYGPRCEITDGVNKYQAGPILKLVGGITH